MGKSSYRILNVNGVDYKCVIGRSNVKIVGPNGTEIVDRRKMSVQSNYTGQVTTTGMIASYIKGRAIVAEDFFDSCGHEGRELRINPLTSEIEQKIVYQVLCEDCYYKIADDI